MNAVKQDSSLSHLVVRTRISYCAECRLTGFTFCRRLLMAAPAQQRCRPPASRPQLCRAASDDDFITRGDGGGAAGGAEWADGEDTFSGGEDAYSGDDDAFGSGAAALAGAGLGAEAAAVQAAGSGTGGDNLLDQVRRCLQARAAPYGFLLPAAVRDCHQPASSPTACRASWHGPVVLIHVASCGSWSPCGDRPTTALLRQRLQQSHQHADAELP
jgi:hypothetical protein